MIAPSKASIMQVVSLELCKTLWELSGWNPDQWAYDVSYADAWLRYIADFPEESRERRLIDMVPAYTLGFLLRKLPERPILRRRATGWSCEVDIEGLSNHVVADTPEEATCKLAAKLFKAGILTKEVR